MTLRLMFNGDRIIGGVSAYSKIMFETCTRLANEDYKVAHIPMGRANRMGIQNFQNLLVYPSGNHPFNEDIAIEHYLNFKADMLITVKEPWCFNSLYQWAINFVPFCPIDHSPVSPIMTSRLHTAFKVIAVSRFGQRELKEAGIESIYIPHGVDCEVYRPLPEHKIDCKKMFGLPPDDFTVGVVAMNRARKMIPRMLRGFARFKELNPDIKTHMLLWTDIRPNNEFEESPMGIADVSVDLLPEIMALGLGEAIVWPERKLVREGLPEWMGDDYKTGWDMVKLYNSFDVLLNCLPPYQQVVTFTSNNTGHKKYAFDKKRISHIKIGDKVLTHEGRMRIVTKKLQRPYDGELIEIVPYYLNSIKLTPEHPVLVRRKGCGQSYAAGSFEWVKANDLQIGDMLVVPKLTKIEHKRKQSLQIARNDKPHPLRKNLPWHIKFTPELFNLFGYYVAEGCATEYAVLFALNPEKDKQAIVDIKRTIEHDLGLNATVTPSPEKQVVTLSTYSTKLSGVLGFHFGKDSHHKSIPQWMFELKDERRKLIPSFIKGLWLGDGWIGDTKSEYTTVSRHLANQLQLLLLKLNIMGSISKNRNAYRIRLNGKQHEKLVKYIGVNPKEHVSDRKAWNHMRSSKHHFFVPIKQILKSKYKGLVYNLEVEEDNSYTTPISVHNCTGGEGFGMPHIEASACGVPPITTDYAAGPETVGVGLTVEPVDYVIMNTPGTRFALASIDGMAEALTKIYNADRIKLAKRARLFAERYDWKIIIDSYWKEFLSECEKELYPKITKEGVSSWA